MGNYPDVQSMHKAPVACLAPAFIWIARPRAAGTNVAPAAFATATVLQQADEPPR